MNSCRGLGRRRGVPPIDSRHNEALPASGPISSLQSRGARRPLTLHSNIETVQNRQPAAYVGRIRSTPDAYDAYERPYGSTAPPAAFYPYSPDRKAERAHHLLKGCRGHLHADAYAGFAGLYEADPQTGAPAPVTEVA